MNILNNDNIKNYILNKIDEKGQNNLLNEIEINQKGNFLGAYNYKEKRLILNIDEAIKEAKRSFYIESNNFLDCDIATINLTIKKIIDHELTHINQYDLILNNSYLTNLINQDIEAMKDNFTLYLKNQNIFLTEYNANYKALQNMINNAKEYENIKYFNIKDIYKYQEYFINSKNYYGSPYEQISNKLNNYNLNLEDFNTIDKEEYGLIKIKR